MAIHYSSLVGMVMPTRLTLLKYSKLEAAKSREGQMPRPYGSVSA